MSYNRGSVNLITGPMGSGKTTELVRRLRTYMVAGRRVVHVIHACVSQTIGGECVHTTHTGVPCGATPIANLSDVNMDAEVIGIDEGQFFPDIVDFANSFAENGKTVIISALDSRSDGKPFDSMRDLAAICETYTKLIAVCQYCKGPAHFTVSDHKLSETRVGDLTDGYHPICRGCRPAFMAGLGARASHPVTNVAPPQHTTSPQPSRLMTRQTTTPPPRSQTKHAPGAPMKPQSRLRHFTGNPPTCSLPGAQGTYRGVSKNHTNKNAH